MKNPSRAILTCSKPIPHADCQRIFQKSRAPKNDSTITTQTATARPTTMNNLAVLVTASSRFFYNGQQQRHTAPRNDKENSTSNNDPNDTTT
jgi:hypothetical protein